MNATVYVDGSFNAVTRVYGSGIVFFLEDDEEPMLASIPGADPQYVISRNVAGEVFAVIHVFEICRKIPNLEKLTIFYDYNGIEAWFTKAWTASSAIAKKYMEEAAAVSYPVEFRKVKAHSGNNFNEVADQLAKRACGL